MLALEAESAILLSTPDLLCNLGKVTTALSASVSPLFHMEITRSSNRMELESQMIFTSKAFSITILKGMGF